MLEFYLSHGPSVADTDIRNPTSKIHKARVKPFQSRHLSHPDPIEVVFRQSIDQEALSDRRVSHYCDVVFLAHLLGLAQSFAVIVQQAVEDLVGSDAFAMSPGLCRSSVQ